MSKFQNFGPGGPKGLITLRGYGLFLSKNHVKEEMLKFFFFQIFTILSDIEESTI